MWKPLLLITAAVAVWGYFRANLTDSPPKTSQNPAHQVVGTAEIIYFEYEPDPTAYDDQQLQLRAERRSDGYLYLTDNAPPVEGRTNYYALNGSVNRVDARQLSQQPVLTGRWLHLVKYISGVSNINSEGWMMSALNMAKGQAKYAAVGEVMFWIKGASDKAAPSLPYTQPLWANNQAVGDVGIFKQSKGFVLLPNKKYGSESLPVEEPLRNLQKVNWNLANDKFRLLYAPVVADLMQYMGLQAPNGITSLNAAQLDRAADWLANLTPASTFAVDFEPAAGERDSWQWNFSDPKFQQTMYELSERIFARHRKLFFSWIGRPVAFDLNGKTFRLDAYAIENWSSQQTQLDDWLAVHENAAKITNVSLPSSHLVMTGFGYTSSTVNVSDAKNLPANRWKAPVNWYLRSLDMLNLQSLVTPASVKLLNFMWPYEDKPADLQRSLLRRFQVKNGSTGYVRQIMNRVMYPMNLVRDAVFVHLCNPRIFYTNYWIFGQSYNPYTALRYAKINGQLSCLSKTMGDFFVYEYQGKDNPPCPTLPHDYLGKDALGLSALVQAHELFAPYQTILDGSQLRETYAFSYARTGETPKEAVWKNDTGEFARAFKHDQPWLQVWRNPKTNQRILLFQDNFAEAFEAVSFSVTINNKIINRKAEGNNLYIERLD